MKTDKPIRRRRRLLLAAGAAAVLVALALADHAGWLLAHPDDMAVYHGRETQVVRVIDGATIEVAVRDRVNDRPVTRVRLWGLDCARLAGKRTAAAAAALTRSMLARGAVLSLEAHRTRGSFGRVLAHVTTPEGGSVNEALLAGGLARADDRWPHALLGRYARLERAAQRQKVGTWE